MIQTTQLLLRIVVTVLVCRIVAMVRLVVVMGHQGSVVGCLRIVGHSVGSGVILSQCLLNWLRVVQHQHIQVFLQVLMSLCLRHDILGNGGRLLTIVKLMVRVEDLMCLVQHAAGLGRHIHRRVLAHVEAEGSIAEIT